MSTQNKEYRIFTKEEPSKLIEDIVISGASPVIDCEHCGRTHYDSTGEHMDEGELEGYEKGRAENPHKYIPRDGQVHHGYVMGKEAVYGCPCNILRIFEDLVWQNRRIALEYIQKRAIDKLKSAEEDLELVNQADEALKPS